MDILTIPKYIQWYITNDCNSNCIHCNVIESSLVKHRKKLTLKQNHKVIDNIDYPNSVIEILGGEPLCYNGLNEILNHIKQNKFRAYLVSNGVLLSPCAKTRQILNYCDEISISVDGIIAESYKMMRQTNNFNTVIKNLTYCVDKLGADKLTVIYVVAKPTMNEPEKIIDFFRSLGVKKITFNTLQKTLRSDSFSKELYIDLEEHLKFFEKLALATHKYTDINITYYLQPTFFDYMEKIHDINLRISYFGCRAVVADLAIAPDSMLFPCASYPEYCGEPDKSLFNEKLLLYKYKSSEIIKSDMYTSFLIKRSLRQYDNYLPCVTCHHLINTCNPCFFEGGKARKVTMEFCQYIYNNYLIRN